MDDRETGTTGARRGANSAEFAPRRALRGGGALLGAVVGFTAVRAVVDAGGYPDEWVLVALPLFGLVGVVGFVVFVSAFVRE